MEKTQVAEINDKICQNCRYSDTLVQLGKAQITMVCRLKPPECAAQCVGLDPATQSPVWVYSALWAPIVATDWCGSFERKLNA